MSDEILSAIDLKKYFTVGFSGMTDRKPITVKAMGLEKNAVSLSSPVPAGRGPSYGGGSQSERSNAWE